MKSLELKIEKNIPIPVGHANGAMSIFSKMEVGDSVFFPKKALRDVTGSLQYFCKASKYSDRFKTRSMDGGVRVWRVA